MVFHLSVFIVLSFSSILQNMPSMHVANYIFIFVCVASSLNLYFMWASIDSFVTNNTYYNLVYYLELIGNGYGAEGWIIPFCYICVRLQLISNQ